MVAQKGIDTFRLELFLLHPNSNPGNHKPLYILGGLYDKARKTKR